MPVYARVFVVAVLGLLALRTYDQAQVWSDERSLWAHAVTVSPDKPRVLINLGRSLEWDQRPAEAFAMYEQALRAASDPRRPVLESREARATALTNMGRLALRQGDTRGFVYLTAVAMEWPEFAPARFQRALGYARIGRCAAMREDLAAVRDVTGQTVEVPCVPVS